MTGQKILIVDDSKAIRMQVRDMLPVNNFIVSEAKDGIEGLELIRQEHPNLVLLDFFMPRMNGWEVLLRIQTDPALQLIPIVVMTGRKAEAEAKVPELFKYFEFIEKPFDQKALIAAVRSALAKAKQRQSVAVAIPHQEQTPVVVATPAPPPMPASDDRVLPNSQPISQPVPVQAPIPKVTESIATNNGAMNSATIPDSIARELMQLQTDLQTLTEQQTKIQAEINQLKRQVTQILTFMKQKLA